MNFLTELKRRHRKHRPPSEVSRRGAAPFISAARTHVGTVRVVNEDRFVALPDAGVWAVADGMGGHHAGDVAAQMLARAIEGAVVETSAPLTVEIIAEAVHGVNAELLRMRRLSGRADISGSTFVALIAAEGRYQVLWAGDSRAYLFRAGRCNNLSRDHSIVQELVDTGIIAPSAAVSHPQAHVVTRAVGVKKALHLELNEGDITSGDLFLLCSDGLSDVISPSTLTALLDGDSIEVMADSLMNAALEAGAPDNVTFIAIKAL